ncbi:hypothetical protein [Streptomyces mangrovi]|uniref:hypothetical protein n=1 Tax=Streptomyces mangrovi TaxID=1206892 RepID=UPI00399C6134
MRMKARPYLHYAPVPGGVYLSGAGTQFAMRGPEALFKVVDVCVPLLEDGVTEDELVAALGSERARPVVRKLADGLRGHGMLLDLDALTVPEPPREVRERHPEALAWLESVSDDPYALFERFRDARILLCGPPAVVLPAARGLARAGARRLVLASPDPDAVAATALRLGAEVLPGSSRDLARAAGEADAVLYHREESGTAPDGESGADWLPDGVPVVAVRTAGPLVLAGPAVRDRAARGVWPALDVRAQAWAAGGKSELAGGKSEPAGGEPAARPAADALAGALAGQALFEALTEGATPGEAHVLHGAEVAAERVLVPSPADPVRPPRALADAAPADAPEPQDAVRSVTAVATPWTGLFALTAGDDLPQMPLALREAEYRAGRTGRVVAWAHDQRTATVATGLEALRGLAPARPEAVPAAGLTEERWLLDGALRLLAADARPPAPPAAAEHGTEQRQEREQEWRRDPETVRILHGLAEHGPADVRVRLLHVPGLDWRLCRAEITGSGEPPALAWGPDGAGAAQAALGTILARVQVRRLRGADAAAGTSPGVRTDALALSGAEAVALLREQVAAYAAAAGVRYLGVCHRADPVLGELPVWYGPVRAYPAGMEGSDV